MCFYLYAPNYNIELKYVNETITLLSCGASEIVTELLIKNNSREKLKQVNIIYPNSFLKPRKQFKEYDYIGTYENRTSELRREEGISHYTGDPSKVIKKNGNILTIGDKNQSKVYSGKAIDTSKDVLKLHDHYSEFLKYEEILILLFGVANRRFSLFYFHF